MFLRSFAAVSIAALLSVSSPAFAATDRVTLSEALARTLGNDPSISAAGARRDAADANIRQSDTSPNPSIGVDVENFGGSGDRRGFSDAETTLSYQQPIELGGKRDARVKLATRQRDAAEARRLIAQLDLFEVVQRAYTEALVAEAEVGLARERLEIARDLDTELARRIANARDPEFAGARAKTQVADAELAVDQARLAAESARALLASYWGGGPTFRLEPGLLEDIAVPSIGSDDAVSADIRLLEADRLAAAANEDLQRSNAVRDPTFNVGVRHYAGTDDVAVMVGGSIPLNIFDNNSGAIDEAAAERRAADLDVASYRLKREREISRLAAVLAISAAEVRQIDSSILPTAERALRQVREGFSKGAFSYLDVIEAQNSLIDTKARRITALRRFHEDKASLDRLMGAHAKLAEGATP